MYRHNIITSLEYKTIASTSLSNMELFNLKPLSLLFLGILLWALYYNYSETYSNVTCSSLTNDGRIRCICCTAYWRVSLDNLLRLGISLFCFHFHHFSFWQFFLPIMLKILLSFNIFSKLSLIASYLTVTSYTLFTSTAYTYHGQL